MEGYVYKWTNFIRGYKITYLTLDGNKLYYSKNKNEKTKKKIIDLNNAIIIDEKKKNFTIDTKKKKMYFKTNTENEKKEWIIKLFEIYRPNRLSTVLERDKEKILEPSTGLITTNIIKESVRDNNTDEFALKKTTSCVVENFVNSAGDVPQIDEYLQDSNFNIDPSKNKRFSSAYNVYYQEINKDKVKKKTSKFESVVNCQQNLQNLFFEMNGVLENFNLLLMSSKFKSKDSLIKIYEDLFNIKQEMKEQLDLSIKNLIEYKEDEEKPNTVEIEKLNIEDDIIREKSEIFFCAKEEEEGEEINGKTHEVDLKNEKTSNDLVHEPSVIVHKEINSEEENRIEIGNTVSDLPNTNIPADNYTTSDEDDSSFEDCVSRMNNDLDEVDHFENKVNIEFKNSLETSILKESIQTEGNFKRSLSLIHDDFKDRSYYFEPRNLSNYPKIKCSNSMLSDMIKSLTKEKISLPIHYNEPLSMLQRQCEKFQNSDLLTKAANIIEEKNRIFLKMCYIAAFIASEMSLNINRILKPFNPILGETFEYFDNNLKYRYISEQVSHHPPISAYICESEDFVVYGDTRCKNKFKLLKGAMEIAFQNKTSILFKKSDEHFTFNKPTVYLKGLIMGIPHYDYSGIVTIQEISGKYNKNVKVVLDFYEEGRKSKPLGYFEGNVYDESNSIVYIIKGNWSSSVYITDRNGNNKMEIWKINDEPFIKNTDYVNNYLISNYACNLNYLPNETDGSLVNILPPTDSRLRPDQRALEIGNMAEAEIEKNRIENKQRLRHKQFEDEKIKYEPNYFADVYESQKSEYVYIYKGGYWEDRNRNNFDHLYSIFK
jgi:hypothetical protein